MESSTSTTYRIFFRYSVAFASKLFSNQNNNIMATHLNKSEIDAELQRASKLRNNEFVIELIASPHTKKIAHLRLKGLNGKIIMHQESVRTSWARLVAARLCMNSSRYKFVDKINFYQKPWADQPKLECLGITFDP